MLGGHQAESATATAPRGNRTPTDNRSTFALSAPVPEKWRALPGNGTRVALLLNDYIAQRRVEQEESGICRPGYVQGALVVAAALLGAVRTFPMKNLAELGERVAYHSWFGDTRWVKTVNGIPVNCDGTKYQEPPAQALLTVC